MTTPPTPTHAHDQPPTPHTRRWTSHATTLEYTTYHGAPALQATTTVVTMDHTVSRATTITHTLWVSAPNTATITTTYSPTAARDTPLPPYQGAAAPVEPCLLLAIFAPSLTEAIEHSLRAALQDSIMAYLAAQHDTHHT